MILSLHAVSIAWYLKHFFFFNSDCSTPYATALHEAWRLPSDARHLHTEEQGHSQPPCCEDTQHVEKTTSGEGTGLLPTTSTQPC